MGKIKDFLWEKDVDAGTRLKWPSIVGLFLIPLIVCSVFGWVLPNFISDSGDRGTFGDMFGAVNTLFSGLAFAGIIYTIYQQGTELKLQRIEVAKTNEQLEDQAKTMNIQRFENTFFQLVSMHQEIIANIGTGKTQDPKGSRYIIDLTSRAVQAATYDGSGRKTMDSTKEALGRILRREDPFVIQYYKHVLNVLKFINDSVALALNEEEKKRYVEFYKVLVSKDEMISIYLYYFKDTESIKIFELLNFLTHEEAREEFTKLAVKYR